MVRQKDKSASVKQVRKRSQLSCDRCRIHKRKCDREEPCGRCVKDNAECSFKKANVTKERQCANTRETSEHYNNKALSVADIDVDAFIATALTKQIPKRWQKGGSSHFNQLIEAPFFLLRIFSLYINLVDWIGDLLKDTRMDRTIATHPCQPSREVSPILWDALEPLAYIVIAITAQMVPTEVEVILMEYSKDNSLYTADILAQEAFRLTVEIFSYPEWFQSTNEWPPEHFAAFMMIHVFQKNSGTIGFLDSSVIIAIEGLEKAGMHREPFVQRRGVRNDTIMEQERDLLIYRIFWSFFEKERVRSWYSGSPARFKAEDYRICLRGEDQSHISLNSLLSDSNTANTCMCTTKTQVHLPVLSKFAFMQAKIGILIGRYYDLLASMSQKITYESTDVARYLVSDFDKEHFELGEEIADLNVRKYFRGGQSAMLQITLQHIRTGFRTKVCELYANKVFKDQYSISQQTINWMLEKRRNIAKIDLLEEGRKNCASWVATCRCSWIFTPKFMHDQLIDLIKAIEPWFVPMQDVGMPMQWLKVDDYNHLVNCFHAICQGRNTLVLMTRRSELQRVSRGVKEVCQLLHSFLMKSKVVQQGEEIASEILNSKELVDLSQLQFSIIGPKCLNSTTIDNESDTTHMTTTFSSSISTPITPLDVQMEKDPSILSTLREINSNELQKALDAWDDDLDEIFGNSETIPTILPI